MTFARRFRSFVVGAVVLGGLAACGLVFAARWHWSGELAASFRWQLAGVGAASVVLLGLLRAWRAAVLVAALSAWLAWPGASLHLPGPGPGPGAAPTGTPLRVASVNAYVGNRDSARLLAWVRSEDADVVAVQEVDGFWLEALRGLADTWPHRVTFPEREEVFHAQTFGMAILSKQPLTRLEEFTHLGRSGGLVAELTLDGAPVRIIAAHPERPGRSERVPRRNVVLGMIAERARGSERCVVLGDLNTSSGSPAFARLLRDGGLTDSRRGFGRLPTWRTYRPIPGLWVDIDHVLVGAGVAVVDRRRGTYTGSDHLPIAADLILLPRSDAGPR